MCWGQASVDSERGHNSVCCDTRKGVVNLGMPCASKMCSLRIKNPFKEEIYQMLEALRMIRLLLPRFQNTIESLNG